MGDVPISAAMSAVKDINNELQIVALVIIGVFAVIIFWLIKVSKDSKALAAEKEKAELA